MALTVSDDSNSAFPTSDAVWMCLSFFVAAADVFLASRFRLGAHSMLRASAGCFGSCTWLMLGRYGYKSLPSSEFHRLEHRYSCGFLVKIVGKRTGRSPLFTPKNLQPVSNDHMQHHIMRDIAQHHLARVMLKRITKYC